MAVGIIVAFVLASLLGIIFRKIHQPSLIGFILAGVIIGSLFHGSAQMSYLTDLGIISLMFMIGLEMKTDSFKKMGKREAIFIVLSSIASSAAMYGLLVLLGLPDMRLAVAMSFSSTAVILDIFHRNRKSETVFGRATILALLVQDIIGVALLSWSYVSPATIVGILVIALSFIVLKRTAHHVLLSLKSDHELIMMAGLSFAFVMAFLSESFGLSPAIGAFLAGLIINPSVFSPMVEESIKSIKSFFIALFFVSVGMSVSYPSSWLAPLLILVAGSVAKFLVNTASASMAGYNKKESVQIGISLSGFGEFLIIVMAGLGINNPSILLAAIVSLMVSGFLENNIDELVAFIGKRKRARRKPHDIILFGCHRTGHKIAEYLKKSGRKFLIIDSNPEVVENLKRNGYDAVYGSMSDRETLESAGIQYADTIISTVPVFKYNLNLARMYPDKKKICVAHTPHEAISLYKAGFDYVVIPEISGGEMIIDALRGKRSRSKHMKELLEKIKNRVL